MWREVRFDLWGPLEVKFETAAIQNFDNPYITIILQIFNIDLQIMSVISVVGNMHGL